MAKAIKKVKEAAAKLAKLRKKPGMSNAGKYPSVKDSNFCGPNGTYPVNTVKRARSALSLAHFSADPGDIRKCVHKKYPQLAADEKKEAKKKSPIAYDSSPFPLKAERNKKNGKYKTGGSLTEDKIVDNPKQFARPHDEYSEIQEDKKSQYVTTLAGDERPAGVNWDAKEEKKNMRKRKRSHFVASAGPKTGSRVARDTIRPKKGKKFTKQTRYPNIEKWEKEDLAVQAKRKN